MNIQIPKPLFDTLTAAFRGEAKRLCRDAARILNQPEKELFEKVFPPGSALKLHIFDTEEAPIQCPAFILEKNLLRRCRAPTILGTGRCACHQTAKIPEIPEHVQQLTRLERVAAADTPLWCNEDTGEVYDSSGAIVGLYKNERLTLYVLEDE